MSNDLWVADRNFCTLNFMFSIHHKKAFFILRQHGSTPYKSLEEKRFIGETETGKVYEQKVILNHLKEEIIVRRIVVELKKATRNGDKELQLFTNLPEAQADALIITDIYKKRWSIETAFQKLEKYLNSEINTLGYPQAALFGFCIALVAFNIYAVVMAAIHASYPDKNIHDEISDYYVAEKIASTYEGMNLILEPEDWRVFITASISEIGEIILYLARNIDLKRFKKNKRGPKKATIPKIKFKGKPHVSTARLLS